MINDAPVNIARVKRKPLAASTYLVRNAGKTIPLTGVIVLAVLLVAGIVSMIDSIPLSIRTIYHYSKSSLGITPRGDASLTPALRAEIERKAPVKPERTMLCRVSSAVVKSIVGKWPFIVIAMAQNDMRFYLAKLHATKLAGRLPMPGAPEALISEPVARNLHLKLGSNLLGPSNADAYSPNNVKVVGIAQTDEWLMVGTIEYHRAYHYPPVDVLLVFARNAEEQSVLDHWAEKYFKGRRAQIFAYHELEKNTNEMFQTLYKILNVVIGTLVLVITFMMAMLMNIYQSQRVQEFGLLQALGYTKRQLLQRVVRESLIVVVVGWALGVVVGFGLLNLVKVVLMDPQAYALDTADRVAFLYSVPIPIAIFLAASLTVIGRFRRFDPVGVVERRLV